MRFRQVHLDFHTSEAIPGIGADFSKEQFQAMLKEGHVDSITVFSKCHHGWAYHPSDANEQHPGLGFDLLGAMIEAAHEIGVNTPVYLSAGLDEKLARRRPDWLIRDPEEKTQWAKDFMSPGYHEFCFNTPYLDILLSQIREVVERYDADGIFLDIVGVRKCYCQHCVASLRQAGKDPRDLEAVIALGEQTYANYTRRVRETIDSVKPGLPVFHNSGHVRHGRRDLARMNSHLELESLPTGGWGYDHFPLSARYVQTVGMEYLGMTGKFHQAWGEFGGFKHPNALRYETALSLALGAKCSIGDQLHPSGFMDPATYSLIGAGYSEVEAKEAWCDHVTSVADIALLSMESVSERLWGRLAKSEDRCSTSDAGAARILTEGHYLFDIVDTDDDFSKYKVMVLPDGVLLDPELKEKLEEYLRQGGKLLATGRSGLNVAADAFAIDLGVRYEGVNPFKPDYFHPGFEPGALKPASFVMYSQGQRIGLTDGGQALGRREDPYFNRDAFHFCSHQHTPSSLNDGGPGMVESGNGIYIAWNVFGDYADNGHLILKEAVLYALGRLLPKPTLSTTLPAQGITTVQHQQAEGRYVNHLLFASPVKKGRVEVIEDLLPVRDITVTLRLPQPVKRVYLAPQGTDLSYTQADGGITYTLPELLCHQMVVVDTE